jgi:hypothetical protein
VILFIADIEAAHLPETHGSDDGVLPNTLSRSLCQAKRRKYNGTRPGPFQPVDGYYGATHKGNNIYIHLVKMPDGATEIKLPPTDKVIIL